MSHSPYLSVHGHPGSPTLTAYPSLPPPPPEPPTSHVKLASEIWLMVAQSPVLSSIDTWHMQMVNSTWRDMVRDNSVWRRHVPEVVAAASGALEKPYFRAWQAEFATLPSYIKQTLDHAARGGRPVPNLFTRDFATFVECHKHLSRRGAPFSLRHMSEAFKDFKNAASVLHIRLPKPEDRKQAMVHEAIDEWLAMGRTYLTGQSTWDTSHIISNKDLVRDAAARYNYAYTGDIDHLVRAVEVQSITIFKTSLLTHLYDDALVTESLDELDVRLAALGLPSERQGIALFQRTLAHFVRDPWKVTAHQPRSQLSFGSSGRGYRNTQSAQSLAYENHVTPTLTKIFSQPLPDTCLLDLTRHLETYEAAFDELHRRFQAAPQQGFEQQLDILLAQLLRDMGSDVFHAKATTPRLSTASPMDIEQ